MMCCCGWFHGRNSATKISYMASYLNRSISSVSSIPDNFKVTLGNLLSDMNKNRCQEILGTNLQKLDVSSDHGKKAAVLVPLCTVKGEPSVIFTLRSKHLDEYRSEVSFPGGKMDDSDPNVQFTALREAKEETGIDQDSIDVWGSLSDIPSRNYKNIVTPIVGNCGEVDIEELNHNPHEVEEIFHCTIASLCDSSNCRKTQFRPGLTRLTDGYTMPVYLGPHRIWGLTGIVLHHLLAVIAPGLYTFKLSHDAVRRKKT